MSQRSADIQDDCVGMALRVYLKELDVNGDEAAVDLTGSPTITYNVTDPDGTEVTKTGSIYGDATNGVTTYTNDSTTFNSPGCWGLRVRAYWSASQYYNGSLIRINVKTNTHRP